MDQVLFHLYHCYSRNGETAKAEQVKKELADKYPQATYTAIVTTGINPKTKKEDSAATKTYESIYTSFIDGHFDQALEEKKIADSLYGTNHWTPQLLYIEAVYLRKHREDSTAENLLTQLISLFPAQHYRKRQRHY